jgi:hypothetical protein
MATFFEELREQRWDDHRFYHHSRVNQTLHLVSAFSFVATYALLFKYPVFAVLFGWTFAMCIRQVGHFFFEPKGYDQENQASHEYKETVKVGYNLRRKVILHSIHALVPLVLYLAPALFGVFSAPWTDLGSYLHHLALLWLGLAAGALLFRTLHLFFIPGRGVQTGLVWFTKILTDPFHDIYLYRKAPLALLRGEMIEPAKQHA